MTIKEQAIRLYNDDDIYKLAKYYDPAAVEQAATEMEKYYKTHTPEEDLDYMEFDPRWDMNWEEYLAYQLRTQWGNIAFAGWCTQYSQDEMQSLVELLSRQSASGVEPTLFLSAGKSVGLKEIKSQWEHIHPGDSL